MTLRFPRKLLLVFNTQLFMCIGLFHTVYFPEHFPTNTRPKEKKKKEKKEKKWDNNKKKKKVNIKFNSVLVLISITMVSGSTSLLYQEALASSPSTPPAEGTFSQALLTITQLFAF